MTSTPQRRISSLRQSLKASTPNFTVQYGERSGAAMRPRILTIFIMRPMKKKRNESDDKGNHENEYILFSRGAQILGSRSPRQLNIVQWHLLFVSSRYGTRFMSPFGHIKFEGGL